MHRAELWEERNCGVVDGLSAGALSFPLVGHSQLPSELRSEQFAEGRQGLPLSVMESACCHLEGRS